MLFRFSTPGEALTRTVSAMRGTCQKNRRCSWLSADSPRRGLVLVLSLVRPFALRIALLIALVFQAVARLKGSSGWKTAG